MVFLRLLLLLLNESILHLCCWRDRDELRLRRLMARGSITKPFA